MRLFLLITSKTKPCVLSLSLSQDLLFSCTLDRHINLFDTYPLEFCVTIPQNCFKDHEVVQQLTGISTNLVLGAFLHQEDGGPEKTLGTRLNSTTILLLTCPFWIGNNYFVWKAKFPNSWLQIKDS